MAISPDFPGLTLSIRVSGIKGGAQTLPEYRDEDIQDPPRVISYMIEAIPDAIFSINAHASGEATFAGSSIALYFYVDGKYVDGTLIDSASLRQGEGAGTTSQGRYVKHNMLRRYQFASRERQIEIVEKLSTSLSVRPRTSKNSSDTPSVLYKDYEIAGRHSVAQPPSYTGEAAGALSEGSEPYLSSASPPSEALRSVATAPKFSSTLGGSNRPPPRSWATGRFVSKSKSVSSPSAQTPATFSTKKNEESATAGSDFTAPEELGTIKIVVCHVNKKEQVAFGRTASETVQIGSAAQEAAKDKSGGLLVRFMAPQIVAPITTWDVGAANDDEGDQSVTYLYHYRTREMLDALGVLPKEIKRERVKPTSPVRTAFNTAFRPNRNLAEVDQRMGGVSEEAKVNEMGVVDSERTLTEEEDEWEMVEKKYGP